jgi:excisionase family DNA binding protein
METVEAQTRPGDDADTKAAGFRDVRDRRYTGISVPKAYSIKTIAEALDVSPRTVRRWIATRKLIAHQIGGVVRITDADFRAFLALNRCA